ncbi:MAG: carbohydrate binding domain-containing protein, partial [Muribaculaceae bacterium]|nr:carbohydrate binding domain-containing protein [Muribaculaceae bacterium]
TVTLPAEILASRKRESVYIQVGGGTVKIWNIKVERGANADPQWTPAASEMVAPKITSTSTTYAKTSTPAQPADSAFTFASIGAANPAPGEYLWTRTVVNYSDGSATKSYSVGRIGADGTDGIPGTPGADGKSTYVHYAYANSADGVTGFSTTYFAGALYVGVCTDNNQADPTTPASYEWARLKGEAGDSVYMLDLSDEMMPMPCDAAGNVAGSYKTSQATVYKGGSVVTSGVTYSIAQATGVSATVTAAGVVTPSALTADRGSIVVQAVVAGVTLKTTLSLYKVKPGVAGAAGTNYTENLLLNSAFAKGSDKWSLSTGATIDSTKTRDGRNSVKIDVSGLTANAYRGVTQSAVLNPALQLKAGTQVTLSAWIYCDDLSTIDNTVNGVKIEIGAMNAAGNRIQAYNANAIPTKTGEWQQFTLTVTLPANTESATAFIFVTKNGRVWVNSPKLELGKNTAPVWTPNSTEMLGEDAVVYQMELSTGSVTRNALGQLSTSTITVQKYKTTGASMRGLTTEKAIRYMRVGVDTDYTALTAATSSYQIPVPNDPALTQIIVELYDGPVTLDRERIPVIQDGAVATENLVRNSEGTVTSSGPVTLNAPLGRWALHEALKPGDTYTFTVWGSVATGNSLAVRVSDLRATSLSQGALVATLAQIAPGVYSAVATVGSAITMLRYDLSTINIYQSSAQAGATIERVKVEKGANYAPIWTKSTHDIDYLTAALKESGSIEGGLILGSLMRLGYTGQKGKYNVTAGMNGIATPSDAPAVWTGGEMIDRAVSTADNAAKTMLRHDGTVYFASNTVRIGERLMQVGDNVQLDESGLSMLAGGNTALHIGDVDIAPLIDAQSINSTLAKKSCSVSNMVYSDSYGNYYPSATGSAVNLHTDECPAGTVLNCDCTISGSFGPTFENETIASSVVVDVLVGTSVIASYSCILWNGSDYRTTLNISNLRTPIKGKVSMRLRWAYDIQPDWNFVNGSPFGNTDLVITNGTLEYSTGNQTTMGRNGLLAVWGQALLSIATDAVTMKFGTHGLRVSAAGIQKLVNGNWQTANL